MSCVGTGVVAGVGLAVKTRTGNSAVSIGVGVGGLSSALLVSPRKGARLRVICPLVHALVALKTIGAEPSCE